VTLPTCVACLGCILPCQFEVVSTNVTGSGAGIAIVRFQLLQWEMNVTLAGRRWQDNHATMSVKSHLRM
jgi:hypothetical protein